MNLTIDLTISFTGIAHLLAFFAVIVLSHRLFQYWKKEKNIFSRIFFYFFFLFAIFMLITAIGGLFFADNAQALRWVIILTSFIQNIGLAAFAYLIVYLKLPRISPWIGAVLVFVLGMISTIWIFLSDFTPYLTEAGGIDWDIQNILGLNLFRSFLFLITFLPLILILVGQIRASGDPVIKRKAFYFGIIIVFGGIVGLFDFILEPNLGLPSFSSDIAMAALSFFAFIFVIVTQKKVSEDLSKPVEKVKI